MTKSFNKESSEITQPKAQGAFQAMLYATGLREQDMGKTRWESPACSSKKTRATCVFCNSEKASFN
jgi:hypothetical protein